MATFRRAENAGNLVKKTAMSVLGAAAVLTSASTGMAAQEAPPYAPMSTMQNIASPAPKEKTPGINSPIIGKSEPLDMQYRPHERKPIPQEQPGYLPWIMLDALLSKNETKQSPSGEFQNAGSDGPQSGKTLSELFGSAMVEGMKEKAGPAPTPEEAPSMGRYGAPQADGMMGGAQGSLQGRLNDADSLSGKFQGPAQGMMGTPPAQGMMGTPKVTEGPKAPMQGQMGYGVSRPKSPGLGM